MAEEHSHQSPLEQWLTLGSIVAALLVIPAVVLQTSSNEDFVRYGEILGIAIWIYFVIEISLLIRIAPDNLKFLRSHKLETAVVVLSAPVFTLAIESESVFDIAPLVVSLRLLRFLRFIKWVKLGKIAKSMKIIRKNRRIPTWAKTACAVVGLGLGLGVLGMIIDKESHSLIHGLDFWVKSSTENFQMNSLSWLSTLVVLAVAGFIIRKSQAK